MMFVLNAAEIVFRLIGFASLGVFVIAMAVGVPCSLVYISRRGDGDSSQAQRLNDRFFVFSLRAFYTGFLCILLSKLIGAFAAES